MKVKIVHQGWCNGNHQYLVLTETGHADMLYEPTYVRTGEIDMPDEIWTEGSGWVTVVCNSCHTVYRERCRPGMVIACPCCSEPELIPDGAVLEASNIMEEECDSMS